MRTSRSGSELASTELDEARREAAEMNLAEARELRFLAAERLATIDRLTAERDDARATVAAHLESVQTLSAENSRLFRVVECARRLAKQGPAKTTGEAWHNLWKALRALDGEA